MTRASATRLGLVPLSRRLRLEACLWLMRESFFAMALFVPPGWLAAADPPADWRLVALMAGVALLSGVGVALNDVLDREADAVTAPYLPLPARLVSVRQALATVAAGTVVVLGLVALASPDAGRLAVGSALVAAFLATVIVYSLVKRWGLAGAAAHTALILLVVVIGWAVAGGGGDSIALVVGTAAAFGVGSNLVAGLRDVDLDGEVGNRTLAVRLGPVAAHVAIAVLDAISVTFVVALAASEDALTSALPFVIALVGLRAWSLRDLLPRVGAHDAGRRERLAQMRGASLARGLAPVALIGVFSLPIAVVTLAVMFGLLLLAAPAYERRIVRGELAAAALTSASSDRD